LNRALTHSAIPNKVSVHLSFHYPFIKPNKLVSLFYTIIMGNKIVLAGIAAVPLFSVSNAFFVNMMAVANRAAVMNFSFKQDMELKPISIPYP
jgi:hypothetical protein